MEANNSEVVEVRHPDVAHDPRDLSPGVVLAFLASLALSVFVIAVILWGAFRLWGKDEFASHQSTNPIMTSNEELKEVGGDPAVSFPAPQVQPNPVADLNKFRVREEQQLNTYGWVDPAARRIHMPIARAIDILGDSWSQQQTLVSGSQSTGSPVAPAVSKTNNGQERRP